jgi:hypothetical protein
VVFSLLARLISRQPAVLFSQNKPATSNQPPVLFSQNKPAPAISNQPTEEAGCWGEFSYLDLLLISPSLNSRSDDLQNMMHYCEAWCMVELKHYTYLLIANLNMSLLK